MQCRGSSEVAHKSIKTIATKLPATHFINSEQLMLIRFTTSALFCCAIFTFVAQDATAHSGNLNPPFGSSGSAVYSPAGYVYDVADPFAIDQTSRIVFGTNTAAGGIVAVLDASGNPDSSFATDGVLSLDGQFVDVKIDSKNRIVVAQVGFD